ncbi:MAG TPA: hypothetical protein H9822_01025 [Candidatus Yaniella excrementavium]|nr:hypothetical protein [Candidatus Yaniella excrementavium]
MTQSATAHPRRHVVGFILGSIIVGVIGLVTAIVLTVSGILNNFSEVSASYEDVFESGIEIGPIAAPVELDDASYVLLSFSDNPSQPSSAEQSEACAVIDEHGDEVPAQTSSQLAHESEIDTSGYGLTGVNHVIYTNFEATEGTYKISCEHFGLLSDGSDYIMNSTAIAGILIGTVSVVIAGILFTLGVINHTRNRHEHRRNPRRVIEYRWSGDPIDPNV